LRKVTRSSKSTTPQTLQEIMNTSYEFSAYHVDTNAVLCMCVDSKDENMIYSLNVFLTVHHKLTIYWLPIWCTNYYLFI